jgi:hypothetical protein
MLTRRIRVYPTRKQRVVLGQWMGVARWTYNRCVAAVKTKHVSFTKKALRTHTVKTKHVSSLPSYVGGRISHHYFVW